MALPVEPEPVKLLVAILWANANALQLVLKRTVEFWGEIDFLGQDYLFDMTDYYESEMGRPLFRRLIAFRQLVSPGMLVEVKLACNGLEDQFRESAGRQLNLDSGYLDHNKMVLASAKGLGQKIYVAQGIYADLVARFRQGRFQPFEWTFPDFKDGRYDEELTNIRGLYLQQLRNLHSGGSE